MNIRDLSFSFGLQEIFDHVNLQIQDGQKVGIVGSNGAGKSTFLKLILKRLEPDRGKIILPAATRIGFLPQTISYEIPSMDITVLDFLLEGRPIKKLEKKLNEAYLKVAQETDQKKLEHILKNISKLQAQLDYYDVYNAEGILLKLISGMNIDTDLLDLKLSELSGGQKSKVAFARLLYSKFEMLLLDEPTNHLDLDSKDFVINYLKNYKGTVLVISHDISFLNAVTSQTLYIDKQKHNIELYNGNYQKYLKVRLERLKMQERLLEKQEKEEEKLKRIIAKYIRGNEKKANIAKDRQKKLARLEQQKVVLDKKTRIMNFKIELTHPGAMEPLRCENISFGYDKKQLLYENLSFALNRQEKFLIVGENGVGKSTLLKLIMGKLPVLKGQITVNDKTTIAYYAQEHEDLQMDKTILESFSNFALTERQLRAFLGNFLFSKNDVYKKIAYLSPGERSRVSLALIALSKANFLVLDEPTNHLDPETQEMIAQVFAEYKGTILLVSHNVDFVEKLKVERMLLLPSGKICDYDKNIILYYQKLNSLKK